MTEQIKLPVLKRAYVKDISFEAPDVLKVLSQKWKPDLHLDLNTMVNRLEEKVFEVILSATVVVKNAEETAYLCEVQQAGIFAVESADEAYVKRVLGCDCPNLLFPFVREVVSNLVTKGGFPPMLLNPVDFEFLYNKALSEKKDSENKPH